MPPWRGWRIRNARRDGPIRSKAWTRCRRWTISTGCSAASVRERALPQLIYTPLGLSSEAFRMVLDQVSEGGSLPRPWRLVARLVKFGQPGRALTLAAALLRA